MRTKNASEIVDDATLVTYHSFDYHKYYDSSSLDLHGSMSNVTFITGRIHDAIHFNSNSSFYQVNSILLLSMSK